MTGRPVARNLRTGTVIAVGTLATPHACHRHDGHPPCAASPDDENDKPDGREINHCTHPSILHVDEEMAIGN
jgi:hypothetical protein